MCSKRSSEDRFWDKVMPEPNSGCWLWFGAMTNGGYGTFWFNGRLHQAHRASYMIFVGEIPSGLDVDHLCRVRCCVNPNHLEAVTHKENIKRSPLMQKGLKTHCPKGHEYTEENTYLHTSENGKKRCKQCAKNYRNKRRA